MPTATLRKFLDWRGWLVGLYLGAIPRAIDNVIAFITTNGVEASGLVAGVGMNWKQVLTTFVTSVFINALLYMRTKPLPEVVEQPVTPPPSSPPSQ
jgi:hypothetical protein